ncbi:uncharacterized protein VICG_00526 [Vittaforma corneae ATCC 50505]|uniref:Endoplasmic reticulum oxidoreductin 1 n=1 Tax=Vittaforma corneae (strain ATCC 50505) TaxID=993615 RepID=L2GQ23_VITCO|nr:uncharacterized protein VICG_00526 [Vittaforma corneae ATCC 50505]ELA42427.1 hypothetical protein VICG_00526 [Vittaforma corneae ATCC 50505]
MNVVSAVVAQDSLLESFNQEIYPLLHSVADSDHFSKIKMAFNERCPKESKQCTLSSCTVPKIQFEGVDGYIDLSRVVESFSTTSQGSSDVWKEMYSLAKNNIILEKVLSGLHFSVTTHLASKHTKILNFYFRNPLLFKKRYKKEYRDNFMFLYSIVRASLATLAVNAGETTEPAKLLSIKTRRLMKREYEIKKDRNSFLSDATNKKSLLDGNSVKDVEHLDDENILEPSSAEEFMNGLPKIGKENIEIINEMVKQVACLQCQKCKLWGTIQVKGLKGAIKALNRMPLFKNEVICLINLFRQMSITMVESKRMLNIQFPILYIIIICHKQMLMLTVTLLALTLLLLKLRRKRHLKTD